MPIPQKVLKRKDEITEQFLEILERHFDDVMQSRVTKVYHTSNFAGELFIHPVHLTNTIKLTTGKSPCDFLEERLLSEAQKMLRETDMPIKDVGYKLTYTEPTNFTKFFKNMCGMTPLQYRRSVKPV